MRKRVSLFVPIAVVAMSATGAAAASWYRPSQGPVVDDWRPPEHIYGSGNRGVDFATPHDSEVRAAADGTVSFSGRVGGVLYVVVDHGDGLRTTYGNLSSTELKSGATLARGAVVGRSGPNLHFGVRSGEQYLDPNQFYGDVVLVPNRDMAGPP